MEILVYFKGLVIGLLLCIPLGPIGVLSLRRTLAEGRASGVAALLGATTSDAVYCSLAGFGITWLGTFLERRHAWIEILAGAVLVFVGAMIFRKKPARKPHRRLERAEKKAESRAGLRGAYLSTFLVALTNPMPLLVFTFAFGAVGVHGWKGDYLKTGVFLAGVVTGSALWAPVLATAGQRISNFLGEDPIGKLNRISGAILAGFGVLMGLLALMR